MSIFNIQIQIWIKKTQPSNQKKYRCGKTKMVEEIDSKVASFTHVAENTDL